MMVLDDIEKVLNKILIFVNVKNKLNQNFCQIYNRENREKVIFLIKGI